MTALIPQTMMPAGAETASMGARSGAASAEMPAPGGIFAGLMSHFGGAPPARSGVFAWPGDAGLPEGGQILPPDLPFAYGDEAALSGLPAALAGLDGLSPQLRAELAAALRNAGAGALPIADGSGRTGLPQAPMHPGALVAAGDEALRAEIARQTAALSPDILLQRMETAGQPLIMNFIQPQSLPGQPLAGRPDTAALISQSGMLAGLLNTVEAEDAGMAPLASMLSMTSPLSQGSDRALPGWTLATPLHQAQQWSEEVGQRIRWMVGNQMHAAELRINPPQLGPIEIRISVQNDQMNVSFLAQQGLVRDALEDAIPRLREMLSQQGYASVNVDVSGHPTPEGSDQERGAQGLYAGEEAGAAGDIPVGGREAPWRLSATSGFIDAYA